MRIALIGGTGKLGLAMAHRFSGTAHEVAIASRDERKAREASSRFHANTLGMSNDDAALWCDTAILAVPYQGRALILDPILMDLRGKVVVDATVPLDPLNFPRLKTETGKSAAEELADMIPESFVFAAFQTVSHRVLKQTGVSHDVLVAGPEAERQRVLDLIRDMTLRPVYVGPLEHAGTLERITVLLLSINIHNGIKESGIEITGAISS